MNPPPKSTAGSRSGASSHTRTNGTPQSKSGSRASGRPSTRPGLPRVVRPRSGNCCNEGRTRADYTNGMHRKVGALRGTFFIGAGLLAASFAAFGEHRLISLGERRLSIDCDGEAGSATVVLIAGGGEM